MPIYEYKCAVCKHEFDEIQKFSDPPISTCPKCQKNSVRKKVSLSAFSLQGEGWYKDGYARPSEKPKVESKASKSDSTKSTPSKKKAT